MLKTKPWLKATGPKTDAGKKRSSRNALKHGCESAQIKRFKRVLRLQKAYMKNFRAMGRQMQKDRQAAWAAMASTDATCVSSHAPNP